MMTKAKAFQGSNVFMSRNLVPPEVFDKLHGVLKDNGAQVFLCCDPSRNGSDDFHVISSFDHVLPPFSLHFTICLESFLNVFFFI